MVNQSKTSVISTVVAVLCIVIYAAAIVFGAVRIITNMGERPGLAVAEFDDLTDRAISSSVFLGFMSEEYQQAIRDYLNNSETLTGVIITGSEGDYAFERRPGDAIIWTNGVPRFKTGSGLSREPPLQKPITIEGRRNVTVQAVYSYVDYALLQKTLKDILMAVLAALVIAFLALLLEIFLSNKAKASEPIPAVKEPAWDEPEDSGDNDDTVIINTAGRLDSELQRAASFEQDLTFLALEWRDTDLINRRQYSQFMEEAAAFFKTRNLIFSKGDFGISVIVPDTTLDEGISKAEDFRRRIGDRLPELDGETGLCAGLSSRSDRIIDAERLMLEAYSALEKALMDPSSCVIAFRSDPEKYRKFISGR